MNNKRFQWRATKHQQQATGTINASDKYLAKALLIQQGYNSILVYPYWLSWTKQRLKQKARFSLSLQARIQLIKQLIQLLSSGFPLLSALRLLATNQRKLALANVINEIANRIESGQSFASSISYYTELFDVYFQHLVSAGEQSGSLVNLLQYWVDEQQSSILLKKKIRGALAYPLIVLFVAFVVCAIIMVKVVPTFSSTYQQFNTELPMITQQLIMLSEYFQQNLVIIVSGIVSSIVIQLLAYKNIHRWQYHCDCWVLRIPFFGTLLCQLLVARFSIVLSTLLNSGIAIEKALKTTDTVIENLAFKSNIQKAINNIMNGESFYNSCENQSVFDDNERQIIAIGESTGHLPNALKQLSENLDAQLKDKIERFTAILEVTFMVVIGVIVGVIIIAIYMPLFKIGSIF